MPEDPQQQVSFGGFTFDRRTLELRLNGELIKLQQQPARVLSILIDRAGALVTRDELQQAIWGGDTFVDFSRGLNFCISQIRAALNDDVDSPRYLETLRGRGYRFIGLSAQNAPAKSKRHFWIPAAFAAAVLIAVTAFTITRWRTPAPHGIGIAPFEAGNSNDRAWSKSLHAQLLAQISHTMRSPVVDLASAADSRVAWRLEGRVDHSSEQYRVTVTLRRADGSVRWSDIFDGPTGDWIDAQNEMAVIVAQAVRLHVDAPPGAAIQRRIPRRDPIPAY